MLEHDSHEEDAPAPALPHIPEDMSAASAGLWLACGIMQAAEGRGWSAIEIADTLDAVATVIRNRAAPPKQKRAN